MLFQPCCYFVHIKTLLCLSCSAQLTSVAVLVSFTSCRLPLHESPIAGAAPIIHSVALCSRRVCHVTVHNQSKVLDNKLQTFLPCPMACWFLRLKPVVMVPVRSHRNNRKNFKSSGATFRHVQIVMGTRLKQQVSLNVAVQETRVSYDKTDEA